MATPSWRDLFKSYGTSRQLYPRLKEIDRGIGHYTSSIDDVTDELIEAGIVVKPNLETITTEEAKWYEVMKAYRTLRNNQTLIISEEILPGLSGTELRKHGKFVEVRYDGKTDSFEKAREKEKQVKLGQIKIGIRFRGVTYTDQLFKAYQEIDVIRAHIMKSANVVSNRYVAVATKNARVRGATARISRIPSIESPGTFYTINLKNIAVQGYKWELTPDLKEAIRRTSYDLMVQHTCDRITWDLQNLRDELDRELKGTHVWLDHHIILGLLMVRQKIGKWYKVITPFDKPTNFEFRLFQLMQRNTLIEYQDEDGYIRRKAPNLIQMEAMFWNNIAYENAL